MISRILATQLVVFCIFFSSLKLLTNIICLIFLAYMEDYHPGGTFTYEFTGFDSQPTDHYMQTWYVDATEDFKNNKPFCIGSLTRHKVSNCRYISHKFSKHNKCSSATESELN